MGYTNEWGEWVEDDPIPAQSTKKVLWAPPQPSGQVSGQVSNQHVLTSKEQRKGALMGASLGGIARKAALTPERRREIAKLAIAARWAKSRLTNE